MNPLSTAPRWATLYSSAAVFLFGLLALVLPHGYAIGAVLLSMGGVYAYRQDHQRPLDRKTLLVLITLALCSVESFISNYWHPANTGSYDHAYLFIFAVPAFYLVRWAQPPLYFAWLGLAGGAMGAVGLAVFEKFVLGKTRTEGFIAHAIQFGNLSLIMGLFCLAGLGWVAGLGSVRQRRVFYVLLAVGAASGISGSLLSGTRGGWIGFPLMLLVLFRAYHCFFRLRTKIIVLLMVVLGAIAIFNTPQIHVKDRIKAAVHDIEQYQEGNSKTSLGLRLEMWQGALRLIKEKPFLGWGKEGYEPAMKALADQHKIHPAAATFDHAHSDLLDKTAKHGLPGLMVLLALYLVPLWYFSPHLKSANLPARAVATAGTLLVVAYMDFGLSQAFFAYSNGVVVYGYWLVIWVGLFLSITNCPLAKPIN